jgi:nucleotide-binding universal stress UspA family protein
VADALLHRLNTPLLLLRPHAGESVLELPGFSNHRILVPLDGSALSETVIPVALALGRLSDARYTLVQVVSPPVMMALGDSVPVAVPQRSVEELRTAAAAYLDRLASQLRQQGYTVETEVLVHPSPGRAIEAFARQTGSSLIALATHGRSGITRLALGSMADVIVHGSSVPVLLLRSIS